MEAGHLLPLPRSREAVDAVVANVTRTQAELPVPIALEPIAALFDWPETSWTRAEFLTEILDRTGALLLLDVANVYANARNRGADPLECWTALPLERIAYVPRRRRRRARRSLPRHPHRPGARGCSTGHALPDGRPPALLLERDGDYPPGMADSAPNST